MRLVEYLQLHSITQAKFAENIGISRSYICLILKGKRLPSVPIALQIEQETGGQVTAVEVLGLYTNNS